MFDQGAWRICKFEANPRLAAVTSLLEAEQELAARQALLLGKQ
jgi:hypothetical protein